MARALGLMVFPGATAARGAMEVPGPIWERDNSSPEGAGAVAGPAARVVKAGPAAAAAAGAAVAAAELAARDGTTIKVEPAVAAAQGGRGGDGGDGSDGTNGGTGGGGGALQIVQRPHHHRRATSGPRTAFRVLCPLHPKRDGAEPTA